LCDDVFLFVVERQRDAFSRRDMYRPTDRFGPYIRMTRTKKEEWSVCSSLMGSVINATKKKS
jgi:hypothetical protein